MPPDLCREAIASDSPRRRAYGPRFMSSLRQILVRRHVLALWLVALSLALKAMVPGGYMVREQGTVLTIAICGDASATRVTRQIVVPQRETPQDAQSQHLKTTTCPYSVLDMAGAAGADALLLEQSLAFIVAVSLAPLVALEPAPYKYLRPPLRGPPLSA
jgi:nucleoside permease NupC